MMDLYKRAIFTFDFFAFIIARKLHFAPNSRPAVFADAEAWQNIPVDLDFPVRHFYPVDEVNDDAARGVTDAAIENDRLGNRDPWRGAVDLELVTISIIIRVRAHSTIPAPTVLSSSAPSRTLR